MARTPMFFVVACLLAGIFVPTLGQTTRQPFLADVAALAKAQAQAMAQACAGAAATASTSVEIVPNIEANIRTFIDPNCLRPTCEQYVPTTQTTPGCPATRELAWDFGQVTAGSSVNTTK